MKDTISHCPKCKFKIQSGWKICPACGEKLLEKNSCAECGRDMDIAWKRCPFCGAGVQLQNDSSVNINDSVVKELHQTRQVDSRSAGGASVAGGINIVINPFSGEVGYRFSERFKLEEECQLDVKECTRGLKSGRGSLEYLKTVYVERLNLWRQAANLELSSGQYLVGRCFDEGLGMEKNISKAIAFYRKSADQGFARAQYNLALKYENGKGVSQDYAKAVHWYREAANQGDASAQTNLGEKYENGEGVSQDYAKAVHWYLKAANQGNAFAQTNLALKYENGEGVSQDYAKAVHWYRKAADQGFAQAQYNLALKYENGKGVSQDSAKAVHWYRKAANQGHASAQLNLALNYICGKGVSQDDPEAVRWLRKAADQGLAGAQCMLGKCYINAWGVPKNQDHAKVFLEKAAAQGEGNAVKELKSMNSWCFITTAICKSLDRPDNCRELTLMRQFRDTYMMETVERQKDIKQYYEIAPEIVRRIEESGQAVEIWASLCEQYLLPAVAQFECGNNSGAYHFYRGMMDDLKGKWLSHSNIG